MLPATTIYPDKRWTVGAGRLCAHVAIKDFVLQP
jgi:hypothetical protein